MARTGVTFNTAGEATTVNGWLDVAVFPATVTVIGPVVAPAGTLTTRDEVDAERTVAAVPLKRTPFAAGVALKPWPWIVTVEPTGPC